jgi:ParB/RepB/Spo0J family partition protein
MTTTETTPKKSRKAATPTVDAVDTFPFEMLEATKTADNVDPNSLIFPNFDSRADSENIKLEPSFADDVKANGILQPPLVTPVRHKGDRQGRPLIVAGRQRVRAAIAAANDKNRVIPVHIKTLTLLQAVIACGVENIKRRSLSFWDEANYMRSLRDEFGLKQTQIKDELGVADSKVSQYLAVFDCDDRVQKMVRKGQLEPGTGTKIRAAQGRQGWGRAIRDCRQGDREGLDRRRHRRGGQAPGGQARGGREGGQGGVRRRRRRRRTARLETEAEAEVEAEAEEKYALDAIAIVKAAELRALLNSIDAKISRMRSRENVDESKLAYERGKLDGLKLASGLKALPKSIATEEEAEG